MMTRKPYFPYLYGVAIVLLFLQACKVTKPYVPPTLDMPDSYRGVAIVNPTDSAGLYAVSWRSFFKDSTLLDLIDQGLAHNFDLRMALQNIRIAERELGINKYEYLPQVNATLGSVNRQYRSADFYANPSANWYAQEGKDAPSSMFNYQSQYASGLNFNWEIDIWGRIAQQKDQLTAAFLGEQQNKLAIQTKLIASIASAYFTLITLDAEMEVAKRNLNLGDSTLALMRLQFDAGEITSLALQQTESQRLLAASLVPELEKDIAVQENMLQLLVGQMPAPVERSASLGTLFLENQDELTLGAPLAIVRQRPDVRIAELELMQAHAEMNIKNTMRYPQLTLSAVLGTNSMLAKNWFNIPGALLGTVGGEVTQPIFRRKKLKNAYEVAVLAREKVEIGFQKTVVEAVAEVSNVIIAVEKQKEQLQFAERRVDNAQLAMKNANLLFKSGYASYLEIITAQSSALRSELDLVELQRKQLVAYVTLYRSLGGGWH